VNYIDSNENTTASRRQIAYKNNYEKYKQHKTPVDKNTRQSETDAAEQSPLMTVHSTLRAGCTNHT